VVLRPAAMQSQLAARGLRRLSLFADAGPLSLRRIRVFTGLSVFSGTDARAAVWCIVKGGATTFPVPVVEWRPKKAGMRFDPFESLADVRRNIEERRLIAERSDPRDPGAPWTLGGLVCQQATRGLAGSNTCTVRTGVFTGGANAVYYLERIGAGRYCNVVEGAKRRAAAVECELEDDLVYEVVRGRDLGLWRAMAGALLLCPHTARTRMRPISPAEMARAYPKALAYLRSMRPALEARRGFAGWEKHIREETFYALQRIGAYTFAPFKAAWRYIASDFIVAVVGPGREGRPRLCNDKVMYIACDSEAEAYYLCGLFSSDAVRWRVVSTMTGTQISTSAVKHLSLPAFSAKDALHAEIARQCKDGHGAVVADEPIAAAKALAAVNQAVGRLYRLTEREQRVVREELSHRYGADRFV
jgi:hypothetical protein